MPPNPRELREFVTEAATRGGFDLAAVTSPLPSARLAAFPDWIERGEAGAMSYLARRGENGQYLREHIHNHWPWARALVCVAVIYNCADEEARAAGRDRNRGWISRYAWGEDYHRVLEPRLRALAEEIGAFAAQPMQYATTVDTAPLVERDAAMRAGLGWQGKNTCLIHPRLGSYFFLGTIVSSLDLGAASGTQADAPLPDRCGSCTRCIDACPTQALTPYAMNASRCLAYFNIELRGSIPEPFRAPMGNNVLGCDICQDVCPWNRRAPASAVPEFQPRAGVVAPLLETLATMSEADYRERFRHSAVKRAKYTGLMRNLAIAMGNSGDRRHRARLERWAAGDDAVVAEHARWALKRLDTNQEGDFA